jgi:hypothetical protein
MTPRVTQKIFSALHDKLTNGERHLKYLKENKSKDSTAITEGLMAVAL